MFSRTDTTRTASVAVPSILAGGSTSLSATWDRPMPDANYEVTCEVYDPSGSAEVVSVTAQTAAGCTIAVRNVSLLAALLANTATVKLLATHL